MGVALEPQIDFGSKPTRTPLMERISNSSRTIGQSPENLSDQGRCADKATIKPELNMKTVTKTIMYLQLAALCFATAFAGPENQRRRIPFRGNIEAVETYRPDSPSYPWIRAGLETPRIWVVLP